MESSAEQSSSKRISMISFAVIILVAIVIVLGFIRDSTKKDNLRFIRLDKSHVVTHFFTAPIRVVVVRKGNDGNYYYKMPPWCDIDGDAIQLPARLYFRVKDDLKQCTFVPFEENKEPAQ